MQLSFQTRYWAINETTVSTALRLLSNHDTIPETEPMHPSALVEPSREYSVLSCFGYQAPSFLIPSAPRCKLTDVSPPASLVVRGKNLKAAVDDFRAMRASQQITNNPKSLSSQYHDRGISSQMKGEIWAGLKRACATPVSTEQVSSSTDVRPSGKMHDDFA